MSRRRFLAATGLMATAAAAAQLPGFAGRWPAWAQSPDDVLGPLLDDLAGPLLQTLAHDTIAGLVAFVVPGVDAYSEVQGVTAQDLGGVAAKGPEFLMNALDQFLPVPDSYTQALAAAMLTGASSMPLPLPPEATSGSNELTATVDQALLTLLENDQTVPLSLVFALVINIAATSSHPDAAVSGTFLSPFANLALEQKMDAWRLLEEDASEVLAQLDGSLPEPMSDSVSGLIEFAAGAMVEFAAFGSFGEWGVFDRSSQTVSERPPGWKMSRYLPGRTEPVHGHDELLGFYRGRRAVKGSWDLTGHAPNA